MKQDWEANTGWFWLAFIGLVLLNLLALNLPTFVFLIAPVEFVVGIAVMLQNRTPGPHRMLGFTTSVLGVIALAVFLTMPLFSQWYMPRAITYGTVYQGEPQDILVMLTLTSRARAVEPEITAEVTRDSLDSDAARTSIAATVSSIMAPTQTAGTPVAPRETMLQGTVDPIILGVTETIGAATARGHFIATQVAATLTASAATPNAEVAPIASPTP